MKRFKKMMAIVIVAVMTMMYVIPMTVFGATGTDSGQGGSCTITVTLPTEETGITNQETANNTYKIYKIFDAVQAGTGSDAKITYKLVSGKSTLPSSDFVKDDAGNVYLGTTSNTATGATGEMQIKVGGNTVYLTPQTSDLTAAEIAAIKAYVGNGDIVATVTTTTADSSFTVTGLQPGYYYITTTTGTAVTVDSTNPNAEVVDKNKIPTVDKKITGASSVDEDGQKALAQIGTDVTYTATITVGENTRNYVYHDKMDSGLTYKSETLAVKVNNVNVQSTNYSTATTAAGDTFTVTFDNDYIKSLDAGTKIVLTYSATINDTALSTDPDKNTAWLNYGEEGSTNKTPDEVVEVYNAQFTVTKLDGNSAGLANAGFVIKNAAGKYYAYNSTTQVVSWVDSESDATEHMSDSSGAVAPFIGLPNGTYTLHEKTVPAGYNGAADSTFTVAEHDYTAANLEQAATVINNSGPEMPSTGGMGTTMFYLFGAILIVGAGVILVTRRRVEGQ